jgi:hypothetical protein
MKRIACCTMMVALAALWIVGCSPSDPAPSDKPPESKPATDTQTPPPGDQAAGQESLPEGSLAKTSGGRAVGAVGKALLKSFESDVQPTPPPGPKPGP